MKRICFIRLATPPTNSCFKDKSIYFVQHEVIFNYLENDFFSVIQSLCIMGIFQKNKKGKGKKMKIEKLNIKKKLKKKKKIKIIHT